VFIPGWREELSDRKKTMDELAAAQARAERAEAELAQLRAERAEAVKVHGLDRIEMATYRGFIEGISWNAAEFGQFASEAAKRLIQDMDTKRAGRHSTNQPEHP
jgi:ribosome modulation factor